MTNRNIVGVDMGGTKIQAGLFSGKKMMNETILPTPFNQNEQTVINQLIKAIETVITPASESIGIGVPSIVDDKKGIVYDTVAIPSWKEVHLKDILEDRFRIRVWVNNDSNCFTLGEKYFGKAMHYTHIVGITLGTGLGTGIIANNRLYCGANTGAGEIGSISYKEGIVEQYCASAFFKKKGIDGNHLFEMAKNNDSSALTIFNEYGKNLADAIKIALYAFDPEIIILGGSISQSFPFFIDAVWQNLSDFMYPSALKKLKIEQSELNNSALLGAVALVYHYEHM